MQFGGIFFVGEFHLQELASGVEEIAGIYAYLFNMQCGLESCGRIEMYIGHKRYFAPGGTYLACDVGKVGGVSHSLCGEAHHLGAGGSDRYRLLSRGCGIESRGSGHRLKYNGPRRTYI